MNRTVLLLLVAVGLAAGLLLALDPFGGRGEADRREASGAEGDLLEADGPSLPGRGRGEPGAEPREIDGEPVGVLVLRLGTATLAGRVTGEGVPLMGARVHPVLPAPHDGVAVRTRRDGTWEVQGLPAGAFELRVGAADHVSRTVAAGPVAEGGALDVGTIDLARLRTTEQGVIVRVTDAFGRPIPGARVLATTLMWNVDLGLSIAVVGQPGVNRREGRTSEQGEARLVPLPPDRYDVVATAPGYQTASQPAVMVGAGQVKRLSFRLMPGVAIEGWVVDPEGNPVEGAFVTGFHQPSFAGALTAKSNAEGAFRLDGLREGRYMVIAYSTHRGQATVNPVLAPSAGHRIALSGAGIIRLRVKTPGGQPVERYRVRPYQEGPFGYVYSYVIPVDDPNGQVDITLPPGMWTCLVQGEEGDVSDEARAKVEVGAVAEVEATLETTGEVRGVVVDPEGQHVAGAEVYLRRGGFPPSPARESMTRTDADGAFVVRGLPLESVKLYARYAGYAPTAFDATPVRTGEAGPEVTVRLLAGGRVEGRVTRGGEPVVSETVSLMQGWNWAEAPTTVTDQDGRYRFEGVLEGTYTVSSGPFEAGARGASKGDVKVPAEGTVVVDLDESVATGGGVVEGVVRRGGQPIADATVYVVDDRGFDEVTSATTDQAGRFRAEGLVAGAGTVQVTTPDGLSTSKRVTIPAEGQTTTLEIEFGTAGLRGRLATPEGTPVSGAWVQIEIDEGEGWERVKGTVTSNPEGVFAASGLAAGRYLLRISATGYATVLTRVFEIEADQPVDLGTIEMRPGATIQGRVADDAGTPIEDVTISLEDESGRPVFLFSFASTGSDGRYRLAGLQPGTYVIGFDARGYAPGRRRVDVPAQGTVVDAVLARGGTVVARVTDPAGRPVPGARVMLLDEAGQPLRRTLSLVSLVDGTLGLTDADGFARIPDVAPGIYGATASLPGHVLDGDPPSVRVGSGGESAVTLGLRPAP